MFENEKTNLLKLAELPLIPQQSEYFSNALEQELKNILEKYSDSIVYEDCLAFAKQDIGEIKAIKKTIKEKAKLVLEELEKPILDFKAMLKTLETMCDSVEGKISQRVEFFKEQDRERLKGLLQVETQKELRRNFLDISLDSKIFTEDLVKTLSKCLTKGGVLTKYAKDEIEKRVNVLLEQIKSEAEMKQQTQKPIQKQSYVAEIQIQQPEKQQEYAVNISRMSNEDTRAVAMVEEKQNSTQNKVEKVKSCQEENKKKTTRKLMVVFKLEVDESISNEVLEKELSKRLAEKGFKSVTSVTSF